MKQAKKKRHTTKDHRNKWNVVTLFACPNGIKIFFVYCAGPPQSAYAKTISYFSYRKKKRTDYESDEKIIIGYHVKYALFISNELNDCIVSKVVTPTHRVTSCFASKFE